MCETWACKISVIYYKGNIFKLWVKWKGVRNSMENWPSETVRDTAKVTINH